MSIQKLVDVFEKFDNRLGNLEDAVRGIEKTINKIAVAVGEPEGELSWRARTRAQPEDLRKNFLSDSALEGECAEMGLAFSQALYLGLLPENGDKIRELLAPAQINHLMSVLECHKKLNHLTGEAQKVLARENAEFESRRVYIQQAIEYNLRQGHKNVVDQLRQAQENLVKQEDKITKALARLEEVHEAAVSSTVKANNIISSNTRVSRRG